MYVHGESLDHVCTCVLKWSKEKKERNLTTSFLLQQQQRQQQCFLYRHRRHGQLTHFVEIETTTLRWIDCDQKFAHCVGKKLQKKFINFSIIEERFIVKISIEKKKESMLYHEFMEFGLSTCQQYLQKKKNR